MANYQLPSTADQRTHRSDIANLRRTKQAKNALEFHFPAVQKSEELNVPKLSHVVNARAASYHFGPRAFRMASAARFQSSWVAASMVGGFEVRGSRRRLLVGFDFGCILSRC